MTIWFLGDSTAAVKTVQERPQTGWFEKATAYFQPNVSIVNLAKNGASTRSFLASERYQRLLADLKPGDDVLIEFGHNDQKVNEPSDYADPWGDFQRHLLVLLQLISERQANPLLMTSIVRRFYDTTGQISDTFGDYVTVVRQLAVVHQIPLIDMNQLTQIKMTALGAQTTQELYMHLAPGESDNYPRGSQDNTHLTTAGAEVVAQLWVAAVLKSDSPIKQKLR